MMALRSPRFWEAPPDRLPLPAHLLAPLGRIWTWEARRRMAAGSRLRLPVPVICVGNLTAGGAGKTPAVMALHARCTRRVEGVHILTRGHGGRLAGPLLVDPARHGAAEVGDEPLLLAALGPVWIGRDRAATGRAAVTAGARLLLMDDGFQNPGLVQDLSLVVVDAAAGFGNGRVIPAGPLREPVATGIARASMLLLAGSAEDRAALLRTWPALASRPMLAGALRPLPTGMDWRGLRSLAFAGIGRPEKFFATLQGLGAELAATRAFADHAPYPPRLCARLASDAARLGAQLVTTEKDAVRLPASFLRQVLVLPVRLEVEDWAPFDAALDGAGL